MFAVAASNVNGGLVSFFHGVQVAVMFALMTNILQFAWWKVKGKKNVTHWQKNRPLYVLFLAMLLVCLQPVCMLIIGSWEDMPNFFFDGGDMGVPCTLDSECASQSCSSGDNSFLINSLWNATGCTTDAPAWAYGYWDGEQASIGQMHSICEAKSSTVNRLLCSPLVVGDKPECHTLAAPADIASCQPGDGNCVCGMDSSALVPNTGIGWAIQICGTYGGFILMFTGVFEATQLHKKIMRKWRALR
jgi:hypothetical protein